MTFRREMACAAACVALWASRAAAGEANAPDPSVVLFKEGVTAGKAGDFARAEAAFRSSYALRPSASTLRNWALTEMRLGKMVEALGHLREALKWQGWTAEQRSLVEQNLDDAYGATGHVAVRTTDGARVAIDGVFTDGVAPLQAPLDVTAGSRRVEAWLGAQIARADVEAAAGQLVHVDLPVASPNDSNQETTAPAPASGAAPAARQPMGGQAPGAPSRTSTWWSAPHTTAVALVAAGGLGLALGLYFDARASSAAADAGALRSALAGRCAGPAVAPECAVLRDTVVRVHTDETLTGVALAVGATAAVGAAVVLALAGSGAVVRTGSVQWIPQFAPGAAGVAGWF